MTTFVDAFGKPQQIYELGQYLDKLQFGTAPKNSERLAEYKALLDAKKSSDIISKVLSDSDLVFSKASDGEIDAFWSLFSTLLISSKGMSAAQIQETVQKIVDILVKDNEKPTLRLAILNHMYHVYHEAFWRYIIFVGILEYSLKTGNSATVENLFDTVDLRIKEWDCTPQQKRKVYDLVLKHLEANEDGFGDEQFEFFKKFLSTFSEADPDLSRAKERVKTLILEFLKDQNASRADNILEFPALRQLRDDSEYSKIFRLLEIFVKEGATQYEQLYKQDPKYITETLGLSHEETLTKIRLLSILSLASTKDTIAYTEVAQATGVDKEEIETLVVEGITRGIFDARLDQKNQHVIIRHAEPRTYDLAHWQRLDKKLAKWKSNLGSVIEVIHTAKKPAQYTYPHKHLMLTKQF